MDSFFAAKSQATNNVNNDISFGFNAYPVGMSIEDPNSDITEDDVIKLKQINDKDHKCPICNKGGDWDHSTLLIHMGPNHDFFYDELDLGYLQRVDKLCKDSLTNSENESSRSDTPSVSSRKTKSSSDISSDSLSSQSHHGKKLVKKSLVKRNSEIAKEKIKPVEI